MLIITDDEGDQTAVFTDEVDEAMNTRMNAECGMGYQVELYSREKDEDGLESYQLLM
jgi:hypothetical protein